MQACELKEIIFVVLADCTPNSVTAYKALFWSTTDLSFLSCHYFFLICGAGNCVS
jgi:hypothetical protein